MRKAKKNKISEQSNLNQPKRWKEKKCDDELTRNLLTHQSSSSTSVFNWSLIPSLAYEQQHDDFFPISHTFDWHITCVVHVCEI